MTEQQYVVVINYVNYVQKDLNPICTTEVPYLHFKYKMRNVYKSNKK